MEYSCGVATLEIASCSLADAGTYRLQAENPLGSDESSCQVVVEEVLYKKPRALLVEQGGTVTPRRQSLASGPGIFNFNFIKLEKFMLLLIFYV